MAERVGFEPTVEFPLHTLSKRAPSTTRTSLRLESTICERPNIRLSHVGCDCLAFVNRITIQQFTGEPTHVAARIVSDLSKSAITYGDLLQLGSCKIGMILHADPREGHPRGSINAAVS